MVLEGSAYKWHAPVQASPSELGLLTLSRAVVQALVSPVGGFLGESPFLSSDSHTMICAYSLHVKCVLSSLGGCLWPRCNIDCGRGVQGTTTTGSGSSQLAA